MNNKTKLSVAWFIVAVVVVVAVIYIMKLPKIENGNKASDVALGNAQTLSATAAPSAAQSQVPASAVIPKSSVPNISVIASNLTIPWDLAFLPGGDILVTERGGTLELLKKDANGNYGRTAIKLPRSVPKGEGGLLGIVLHPNFNDNHLLYMYMTTAETGGKTMNAVFRYTFENGTIANEKAIVKNIPGSLYHDGGRLAFGPDGLLYITTGDAETPNIAQDLKSLGGKILRLNDDGTIPADNPFGTAVYSYGHRNPQGLTWDNEGRLWETEHGRSGALSGMDELNIIVKGKNYGWPDIEGNKERVGMVTPVYNSGPDETWAPASALYYKGSVYFGGLKGESLYEAILNGDTLSRLTSHLSKEYGRIRTVRLGPDGMFYFTTSNRDGRGKPTSSDDRIIRINPDIL